MKCVKLLLSKGANWKVKDNKGRCVASSEQSLNNSNHISFLFPFYIFVNMVR